MQVVLTPIDARETSRDGRARESDESDAHARVCIARMHVARLDRARAARVVTRSVDWI